MDSNISCPVCDKKFPKTEIDKHIDKCLFLNSSTITPTQKPKPVASIFSKRPNKDNGEESPSKKIKTDNNKNEQIKSSSKNLSTPSIPLAEKVRPTSLDEYVGQEHLTGEGKLLKTLLNRLDIPSMILWGPPGCGKTTIASIISKKCKENSQHLRFVTLSATMAGVNDIKEAVKIAKNEMQLKRKTILFLDEIHRFNKLQQDIFLPHVESGTITLIGATTENPSFSLNSALLSRCRVIVLEKLSVDNLKSILERALCNCNVDIIDNSDIISANKAIKRNAVEWLAEICDGDGRVALNTLQIALNTFSDTKSNDNIITLEKIKDSLEKSHMLYDKRGEEHYNLMSAVHKSIRASDQNAALYWVTRMLVSGEDPLYIARRLLRAASEDVGLADPNALTVATSTLHACQFVGMPECEIFLVQCAIYLARAPKSREMDRVLGECKNFIKNFKGPQPGVPLRLRNAPTKLMKDLGYGKGYNMLPKSVTNLSSMPEGLENVDFFKRKNYNS
ncbi:ATPase WRNIP1-like [Chrysoperla carnea]|uniref:ATPase WRNIP1-like n=1 Tax=Chrysoperla carnea TaxID=189513 RepID=UPI001D070FB4|nr:ATPase WRNIP1-like [Chrysoperla carnea]